MGNAEKSNITLKGHFSVSFLWSRTTRRNLSRTQKVVRFSWIELHPVNSLQDNSVDLLVCTCGLSLLQS
uniref:Uncharacterized protein n=1 Tax=Rhizophora mucronata TaxID=61149 RepID=A0A2P2IKJ4_RHIMU